MDTKDKIEILKIANSLKPSTISKLLEFYKEIISSL